MKSKMKKLCKIVCIVSIYKARLSARSLSRSLTYDDAQISYQQYNKVDKNFHLENGFLRTKRERETDDRTNR